MNAYRERAFQNFPPFAAWLYDRVFQTPPLQRQYEEIARDLNSRVEHGSVLDVGTGPGWLLFNLHRMRPDLQLYGIDISRAMIERARRNLSGINVRLETSSVVKTAFKSEYFDLITCTGSLYLWNRPGDGLKEIHRILKSGRAAYIYETVADVQPEEYESVLKKNSMGTGLLMRILAEAMLKKQLQMTYRTEEVRVILRDSMFEDQFEIERIELVGMPIWIRISLFKRW